MLVLVLSYLLLSIAGVVLLSSKHSFDRQRDSIDYRIHVRGIQGKTTVTRYLTAILRDSGLRAFGTTAGSASRVILPNGEDAVIRRRRLAIHGQLRLIRSFATRRAQAVVVECMGLKRSYQAWLGSKAMASQIVVITNAGPDSLVREPKKLAGVARKLARSLPSKSIVVTAEGRPEALSVLREACARKGARIIKAPVHRVTKRHMQQFAHVAHKENVAIGLAVAKLLRIPAAKALASMASKPYGPSASQSQLPVYSPTRRLRSGLQKVLHTLDSSVPAIAEKQPRG